MDARRLFLPIFAAALTAVAVFGALGASTASAQVPYPDTSAYLRAAIRADIEAKGHKYGGDCKFDTMYLAHGQWCSMVQSVGPGGAVVTYGPFATDDITTAKFVREGVYGWKNEATGIGSPQFVPVLSAEPGEKPNSWVIMGMNFPQKQEVVLFDGSGCGGAQRCPGDHRLVTVTAGADGAFRVTVELDSAAKPLPNQTKRLIQASGGTFIQVAFSHEGSTPPTPIEPPTPAPTVPSTPQTPTVPSTPEAPAEPDKPVATDESDDDSVIYAALAGLGLLAAAGGFGIVTLARRR